MQSLPHNKREVSHVIMVWEKTANHKVQKEKVADNMLSNTMVTTQEKECQIPEMQQTN